MDPEIDTGEADNLGDHRVDTGEKRAAAARVLEELAMRVREFGGGG